MDELENRRRVIHADIVLALKRTKSEYGTREVVYVSDMLRALRRMQLLVEQAESMAQLWDYESILFMLVKVMPGCRGLFQ